MRAERIAPEGSDSGTDKDSEEPTERVPTVGLLINRTCQPLGCGLTQRYAQLLESTTKRKRSEPEDHDKEPPSSSTGVESSHDRYGKERRPKKRANLYGNASDCSIEPVRFSEVYQTYRKLRLKKAIGDKGAEGEPETELMVIDSPLTEIESVSTQSENEESEDLGRLALDEEHQGDEDIIEDKVHKKSLSLDVKRTLLANLPPYSMPEHLSNEFLGNSMVRKYLRWGFAVPTQSSEFTVTFLDGSDVAGFSAQYESNPDLPKEPGQHGIWVHEFERPKVDNQEVVVFIGNKKGQWNYRGHYLRGPSAQMSTESWNKQSDTVSTLLRLFIGPKSAFQFRHTWISDLLRLDRDSCCRFRAETYLRIEKKDITPASLKEQMDYDKCMRQSLRENNRAFGHPVELSWAIREIETGVSFGMVNGVLSRGDMVG